MRPAIDSKKKQPGTESQCLSHLRILAAENDIRNFGEISQWLQSLHAGMKLQFSPWSYIQLNEALGLGKNNLLGQVIMHKRRLSQGSAMVLCEKLKLLQTQKDVLLALVKHELTRDPRKRQRIWEKLEELQPKRNKSLKDEKVFLFLDEWHHMVVFEVIGLFPAGASSEDIVSKMANPISQPSLQKSLNLLLKLNLVKQDSSTSRYSKVTDNLDLGSSIAGMGVLRFHQHMMDLAKDSLAFLGEEKRNVSSVTVSCKKSMYPKLTNLIEEFQKYLLFLTHEQNQMEEPDMVFQVNFQLFPLTKEGK